MAQTQSDLVRFGPHEWVLVLVEFVAPLLLRLMDVEAIEGDAGGPAVHAGVLLVVVVAAVAGCAVGSLK